MLSKIILPNLLQQVRDMGSILGSGRSPGGVHGNPFSILAWRIPWIEEPGRLQSMGLENDLTLSVSNSIR